MRWSSAQPYRISSAEVNATHRLRGGRGARSYGKKTRTTGNSPVRVREPSVCRHLSQACGGARFGGSVHADVASSPWISISAGIPARVGSLGDSGGDSAPDSEDSQIGSGIDRCVDDCRNSQSHFRVGIWVVLCRCSPGDGADCHLSLADTHALPLGRKCGDDGCHPNAPKIVGQTVGRSHNNLITVISAQVDIIDGGHLSRHGRQRDRRTST